MKISGGLFGLNISTRGMSIQRKKMDLIAENISNADTVRTEDGQPYQRKYLKVETDQSSFAGNLKIQSQQLKLQTTNGDHMAISAAPQNFNSPSDPNGLTLEAKQDERPGEMIYMPENPDANDKGYVQMSNVNVMTEMVDMIAATRSYEANLTALTSSKQMIKDSLEI